MSGSLGTRPGLAPPGHPCVDQAFVVLRAVLGPEPETLGDPGTEALDQHVRLGDQRQHAVTVIRILEVGRNRATAAHQIVATGGGIGHLAGTLDAHHIGTEIAEDHARVGPRADPGKFDDP